MAINATGSGQKAQQMAVMTGTSNNNSAAFTAQVVAGLVPVAPPPAFLSKGNRPDLQVPQNFLLIYQELLNFDASYRI
jgi:hypothetical protein